MKKSLIALGFLMFSCSTNFEDPSLVQDLRILAIRTEPCEFIVAKDLDDYYFVNMSLLLGAPSYLVLDEPFTCVVRHCDITRESPTCEGKTSLELRRFKCRVGNNTISVYIPKEVVQEVQLQDPTFGTPVHSGVAVWLEVVVLDQNLFGLKSVLFSPENPKGRKANQNPGIGSIEVDGKTITLPLKLSRNKPFLFEVVPSPGSKEMKLLPALNPPGEPVVVTEFLTVSFYSDAGAFSKSQVSDKPQDIFAEPTSGVKFQSTWEIEATDTRKVRFWFVLDDSSGGVAFTTLEADID
jgi:hypothetical protein